MIFFDQRLTIASVLHLSRKIDKKCIVVVGSDERIQWERSHQIQGTDNDYGVIFNPIIKERDGHQGRQTKNWPMYFNTQSVEDEMSIYNLPEWLIKMHLFLPNFPQREVKIGDRIITPSDWQNSKNPEENIDRSILSELVFNNIINL